MTNLEIAFEMASWAGLLPLAYLAILVMDEERRVDERAFIGMAWCVGYAVGLTLLAVCGGCTVREHVIAFNVAFWVGLFPLGCLALLFITTNYDSTQRWCIWAAMAWGVVYVAGLALLAGQG